MKLRDFILRRIILAIPVVFGVLTTNTVEQALERSNSKLGNKGWDAALTAIEMADLNKKLS